MGVLMSRLMVLLSQKEQRDGKRYKQKDIAAATGLSPATITRWMNDDIEGSNLATVRKLCDWLDCDVGDLVQYKRGGEVEPA